MNQYSFMEKFPSCPRVRIGLLVNQRNHETYQTLNIRIVSL